MRPVRIAFVVSLVLPALLSASGHVAAFCEILEPPSPLPTQVNGTQVEIQLTEGFARVVIIKEFYNPSEVLKEGQVFFPLEKGHELITDLRLKIGNVVYNSSAGDRGEALDDFLDAVAQGQDAALVQYDPPRDVYWIAVAIPPREARTTITTLEMPLTKHNGLYEYHYRLSVDARDSVDHLRVHVRVETTRPLDHVHLLSHPDLPILRTGDRVAEAYINDTSAARGTDLRIHFGSTGASIAQFVDASGDRFVRYAVDSEDPAFVGSLEPMPRSMLVAVDASGSMSLDGRWRAAKDAILRTLGDLRPGETFGIAAFGGPDIAVFDRALRDWTAEALPGVTTFLDRLPVRGSTSLTAAFLWIDVWARDAWSRGQQPIFVLLSDGAPTRGPLGLDLENAFSGISYDRSMPIFALVVNPNDHAAETLLYNLSHYQRGDAFTLDGANTAGQVDSFLASISVPVLRDLRSAVVSSSVVELANQDPQTLLAGGEAVLLARLEGVLDDAVDVRLSWADSSGVRSVERTFPGSEIPTQSLLRRQWLLTRIHGMLEALRAHEDPVVLEALKALATENRIVTPYTSLLVVIPLPASGGERDAAQESEIGSFFSGLTGFPAASAPGGRSGPPSFSLFFPLLAEARRVETLRREFGNPLVADREVDVFVRADTPEAASFLQAGGTARFVGTYLQILEVGDRLVGIVRYVADPLSYVPNAIGVSVAVLSLWALAVVRRRRSSTR